MNKVDLNIVAQAPFAKRYDNYIGGEWRAPRKRQVFRQHLADHRPARSARSRAPTRPTSRRRSTPPTPPRTPGAAPASAERALILNRIADRMEANLGKLALAETWDNGKPIRETTAADMPLAIDHFRYFAGAIRGQEGSLSEIDHDTVAYHFHEPLGVVGQIIPWNFPILMAVWKLAPALAAGNCVVLKPAEQTPASILVLDRADRRPAAAGRAQHRQRLRPRGRQAAGLQQRGSPRSPSPARPRPAG